MTFKRKAVSPSKVSPHGETASNRQFNYTLRQLKKQSLERAIQVQP